MKVTSIVNSNTADQRPLMNGGLMSRLKVVLSLCLPLVLLMSAGTVGAATLYVNCGGNGPLTSIGAALDVLRHAEEAQPNVINVSGICRENVHIDGLDRLTLNGVGGAQIIDASNQTADTIIITRSQGVVVQGFAVHGGYDAFDIYGLASVRLVNVTSQGALYDGVGAYRNASVVVVNSTLQNNGYAGVLAFGADVTLCGVTLRSNYEGIAIDNEARVLVRVSDPFYDDVKVSNAATIVNNQDFGVLLQRGGFQCATCSIGGNTSGGMLAEFGATAKLTSYGSATVPNAPPTSVTANGAANGVVVGALASVTFTAGTTVSGASGYQIVCKTPTSVTRNAALAAGSAANTNCTDY